MPELFFQLFLLPTAFHARIGFAGCGLLNFFTELCQMISGDEEWRLADDLFRAPTKNPLGGQIPALYVTLEVHGNDRERRGLDDSFQWFVGLPQMFLLLRHFLLGPFHFSGLAPRRH